MTDRSRLRRGRAVHYLPTDAEETANGAGPWLGMITDVNLDGTFDLIVQVPNPSSLGDAVDDPLITEADADATYGQAEADLINELKDDLNILAARVNDLIAHVGETRKSSVSEGTKAGQFSLRAGLESD